MSILKKYRREAEHQQEKLDDAIHGNVQKKNLVEQYTGKNNSND